MRRNKTTIAVFLVLTILVLTLIVYLGIGKFNEKSPVAPEIIEADNQKAAAYMKTEIRGINAQLLRAFPEDTGLVLASVRFYKEYNSIHKVIETLENGLKYNPKNFEMNKIACDASSGIGQYEKSVVFGKKALAINPADPGIYEDIADALILSGEYLQAIEMIEKRIRLFGDSMRSHWLLGKSYLLLMDYEKAKKYYEKALHKDPRLKKTYSFTMAKIHMKLKQPEEAKKYMKIHTELVAERRKQELDDAKNKNYLDVLQSTESELLGFSKSLVELSAIGTKLYTSKRKTQDVQLLFKDACSIFENAIAIAPDNADMHREFATMYIVTSANFGKAQKFAKKAVKLNGSAENYYLLGYVYSKKTNWKKAMSAFGEAVKLAPENMTYKQAYNLMQREIK